MQNTPLARYSPTKEGTCRQDENGQFVTAHGHESLIKHWKSNHADIVARLALFTQREDLPVDRIPAYRELIRLQEENIKLKRQILGFLI